MFIMAIKVQKASKILTTEQLDQRGPDKRDEPAEQLISFPLANEDPLKGV